MFCSAAASHTLHQALTGSSGIGVPPRELLLGSPADYRATLSFSREYIAAYYHLLIGTILIVSAVAFAVAGFFHISAIHRYRHRRSQIRAQEGQPLIVPGAESHFG